MDVLRFYSLWDDIHEVFLGMFHPS